MFDSKIMAHYSICVQDDEKPVARLVYSSFFEFLLICSGKIPDSLVVAIQLI